MRGDMFSSHEYKELLAQKEHDALLNPKKRDKYLKDKAERERVEKIVRKREQHKGMLW